MEQAIKKANTQGYKESYGDKGVWLITEPGFKEKVCLDPLFWQCLGKAEGWSEVMDWMPVSDVHCATCDDEVMGTQLIWKYHMHSFIDHLIAGKDIDSFFTQLLNK